MIFRYNSALMHNNHRDSGRIILILAAVMMPFLFPCVLMAISGHSIFTVAPYYVGGDAVARYDYIRNILDHGRILGYNSYDFVTAKIPSLGSAWGFFWSLPYLAFGRIFGWGFNSPIMANILFLCLANLIFIYLTEADKKTIALVAVMSCLLYINVDYSISAMSDPSRYAITIILTGMMYRLSTKRTSALFRYAVVPATIIFGSATFIMMAAFVIPYCLIVIRISSRPLKYMITLAAFGVSAIGIKKVNSKFCTPYFEVFNMKKDAAAFREGLGAGVAETVKNTFHNLIRFTWGGLTHLSYQDGKFTWFVIVCWVMMLALAYLLIFRKLGDKRDILLAAGALYLLVIFIAGYIVLYDDEIATLIRGINTALCGAVYLMTLMDSKKASVIYIVLALAWAPFFVSNFLGMCGEDYRCLSDQDIADIQTRRDIVAEYIHIDPDADPWDNTVAIRYGGRQTAFVIPSGAGKASMHKARVNEKARYVLIGHRASEEDIDTCIREHEAAGHRVLFENEDFTILIRE